jgi:hypothetical protein
MDTIKILSSVNGTAERSRQTPRPVEAEDDYFGPDLLRAVGFGETVEGIRDSALAMARQLYGPDAGLEIQEISEIRMTMRDDNLIRGTFNADVFVRCLNFTELGL